jgi:CBS domain-containing protein
MGMGAGAHTASAGAPETPRRRGTQLAIHGAEVSMQLVSELMSPDPIFVRPSTSLPECGRFLEAHRIRHLPVVAVNGEVVGLLNDSDVWAHGVTTLGSDGRPLWAWHRESDARAHAGDLMVPVEVATRPDEPFGRLVRRWKTSRQDAAIVVDARGHLVGIVTEHGIVAAATLLPGTLTTAHAGTCAPITASDLADVAAAWRRVEQLGVRHLVLMSGTDVVGVASVRDLALLRSRPNRTRPTFVPQETVYTATEGTTLRAVAGLMARHKIGLVPILDHHGYLQRVISRRDIMDVLFAALDEGDTFDAPPPSGDWSRFAPETVSD